MTKEELDKEAGESWWNDNNCSGALSTKKIYICGYLAGAEPREKRIAEQEEKISILLSCRNCPENKGGYICQKEYEDKCLAQKIQYIKELKEEIAELKDKLSNLASVAEVRLANWQKYEEENKELKEQNYKTKVALRNVIDYLGQFCSDYPDCVIKAEQFLKECE